MASVAIIKTGNFETFCERDLGADVSLGDVIRTTPLLELFPRGSVHWFTSAPAERLLAHVPDLAGRRVGLEDAELRRFDLVLNLERTAEAFHAIDQVPAGRVVGFVRGPDGEPRLRSAGMDWELPEWKRSQRLLGRSAWPQWLFALLGKEWNGERYRFGVPPIRETHDIGLNWRVGVKWPFKALPLSYWKELERDLRRSDFRTSWQEGFEDLEQYLRWIASGRLLLTHDSLGMHLALALGKQVAVFFKQTNASEVPLYRQGVRIPLHGGIRPATGRVHRLIARRLDLGEAAVAVGS